MTNVKVTLSSCLLVVFIVANLTLTFWMFSILVKA